MYSLNCMAIISKINPEPAIGLTTADTKFCKDRSNMFSLKCPEMRQLLNSSYVAIT